MHHANWKTRRAKELSGQESDLGPQAQQVYDETELAMKIGRTLLRVATALGQPLHITIGSAA